MPRTSRLSILPTLVLMVLALGLTACGGDDDVPFEDSEGSTSSSAPSKVPTGDPTSAKKSCQAIVGSGAVEDIQKVFDKYKGNSQAFSEADAQTMRNALDRLAQAGDNAEPDVRDDVVKLVADVGSQMDSRAGLPGTGKVTDNAQIQKEIDALCR